MDRISTKFLVLMCFSWVVLACSGCNWFYVWLFMEFSTIFMCGVISTPGQISSTLAAWKFLLIQMLSSSVVLIALAVGDPDSGLNSTMALAGLLLKMGVFPFLSWILYIIESLSWLDLFMMASVLKIVPLFMLTNLSGNYSLSASGLVSVGSLIYMIYCRHLVKSMLVLSSSLFMGWMLGSSIVSSDSSFWFLLIYSFHLFLLVNCLNKGLSSELVSLYSTKGGLIWDKLVELMLWMSFMGLPPFGVFQVKVELIASLIESGASLLAFVLGACSMVAVTMYLRILFPSIMSYSTMGIKPLYNSNLIYVLSLGLSSLLFMWMM